MPTEEQAKTKWCPFARDYAQVGAGSRPVTVNRTPTGLCESGTMCIATACMAWHWGEPETQKLPRQGYCGLAGRGGWSD